MKICIYGAGAIGGYIGVLLKNAGADVSLIARGAHLEAIRKEGLKLQIGGGEKAARMPATDDPNELGPQDYVIVTLKAHQAWEVAEQMAPLLGKDTAVVTAQNGLPATVIAPSLLFEEIEVRGARGEPKRLPILPEPPMTAKAIN